MKEVIWVIGASAVGKETFIQNVLDNPNLRERLGWQDSQIAVCSASVNNIGMFDNDPVIEKRSQIISEVGELLEENDVVLVKWQFVDSQAGYPEEVVQKYPDPIHRGIVLHTPRHELIERLKEKPWWNSPGKERAFVDSEVSQIDRAVSDLDRVLSLKYFKSGINDGYQQAV